MLNSLLQELQYLKRDPVLIDLCIAVLIKGKRERPKPGEGIHSPDETTPWPPAPEPTPEALAIGERSRPGGLWWPLPPDLAAWKGATV